MERGKEGRKEGREDLRPLMLVTQDTRLRFRYKRKSANGGKTNKRKTYLPS